MKKSLIVIFLLTFFSVISHAQVHLEMKVVQVSSLKKLASDSLSLHAYDGPYVLITASFTNVSTEEILLNPSKSEAYVEFKFRNKVIRDRIVSLGFSDLEILKLKPEDKIEVVFGSNILLGTNIMSDEKDDYTREMIEILPTLKLIYKEGDQVYKACEIQQVLVK
jgi:hypothetical protein